MEMQNTQHTVPPLSYWTGNVEKQYKIKVVNMNAIKPVSQRTGLKKVKNSEVYLSFRKAEMGYEINYGVVELVKKSTMRK